MTACVILHNMFIVVKLSSHGHAKIITLSHQLFVHLCCAIGFCYGPTYNDPSFLVFRSHPTEALFTSGLVLFPKGLGMGRDLVIFLFHPIHSNPHKYPPHNILVLLVWDSIYNLHKNERLVGIFWDYPLKN